MNLTSLLSNLNYGTILLLMLIESTVIPFPSEVVVAPAAYHAAAGYQNVFLVVLFATIGADLGAMINYVAAYYLGRPIIYSFARSKWGKMCLINEEKVQKSEKYFSDHGVVATLTGRLLPVIRQLSLSLQVWQRCISGNSYFTRLSALESGTLFWQH